MLKFLRESYVAYQVLSPCKLLHRQRALLGTSDLRLQIRSHSFLPLERFHHDEDCPVPVGAPLPWCQWLSVHVQVEDSNASKFGARSCH